MSRGTDYTNADYKKIPRMQTSLLVFLISRPNDVGDETFYNALGAELDLRIPPRATSGCQEKR